MDFCDKDETDNDKTDKLNPNSCSILTLMIGLNVLNVLSSFWGEGGWIATFFGEALNIRASLDETVKERWCSFLAADLGACIIHG